MRFLVDNALSPLLADFLTLAGHDAVHVRALRLAGASDLDVFEHAAREDRVIGRGNVAEAKGGVDALPRVRTDSQPRTRIAPVMPSSRMRATRRENGGAPITSR